MIYIYDNYKIFSFRVIQKNIIYKKNNIVSSYINDKKINIDDYDKRIGIDNYDNNKYSYGLDYLVYLCKKNCSINKNNTINDILSMYDNYLFKDLLID